MPSFCIVKEQNRDNKGVPKIIYSCICLTSRKDVLKQIMSLRVCH